MLHFLVMIYVSQVGNVKTKSWLQIQDSKTTTCRLGSLDSLESEDPGCLVAQGGSVGS